MVVTTGNVYGNEESNKVMLEIAGYKTPLKIIKDYFGLRDDELKNSKRLKQLGVKWLPRHGELGVTKETFDLLFNDVLDYGSEEGFTSESNLTSTTGVEGEGSLQTPKKRARKGD